MTRCSYEWRTQQQDRPFAQLSALQIATEDIALGAAILPIYHLLKK
ncbi:hypothetical protein [Rodentibacter haemolyticus]|uniref:Uncharacterized protein n=1 Tax=Rodentibacter haemolyticus TaxID=2778911 RepID=A0ABX6V0A6_9PAST|nr:hypothetical protein [Rodentibacter haemolyticus]QPB43552.1 hypothetical protein IHV77_05615 [Rodentibacter haemolyticus]